MVEKVKKINQRLREWSNKIEYLRLSFHVKRNRRR